MRSIASRPPNEFWIPRTEEQQRTVVEAMHTLHGGTGGEQRTALQAIVKDIDSHIVALRRLRAEYPDEYPNLSDIDRDETVMFKLASILEVEATRLVARFGIRSNADPAFEYEIFRLGLHEQLADLYKMVCLDQAAISLANAIRRNNVEEQRWNSELCRENPLYRAMHTLYQRDRPRSLRQLSNTGYFQPPELAEVFSQNENSVPVRVSKTEGRMQNARVNPNTEIVDPTDYLPAGGRGYHLQQWRPLAAYRKDRKL